MKKLNLLFLLLLSACVVYAQIGLESNQQVNGVYLKLSTGGAFPSFMDVGHNFINSGDPLFLNPNVLRLQNNGMGNVTIGDTDATGTNTAHARLIVRAFDDNVSDLSLEGNGTVETQGSFIFRIDVDDSDINDHFTIRNSNGNDVFRCHENGQADFYGTVSSHDATVDAFWADSPSDDGLHVSNAGDDGIFITGAGGHGLEINAGITGIYVHDPSNHGIYSDQSGLQAGWFRNAASSSSSALYVAAGNDANVDILLGGNGIVESAGHISMNLDNNTNGVNDFFQVVNGTGSFVSWVNENGNGGVTGNFSKGGGSFKIDHPLDPENKYLYHSFVESPDMMNVYNGIVILDVNGEATVEMEDWFDALNRDYRYQLTSIGAPGPNLYIAQKITGNIFKIAGGKPGSEVSWQVTGIRQDPFANANRISTVVEKEPFNKGKYVHPEAYRRVSQRTDLNQVTLLNPADSNKEAAFEEETEKAIEEVEKMNKSEK